MREQDHTNPGRKLTYRGSVPKNAGRHFGRPDEAQGADDSPKRTRRLNSGEAVIKGARQG